jgi:hypothetical protein
MNPCSFEGSGCFSSFWSVVGSLVVAVFVENGKAESRVIPGTKEGDIGAGTAAAGAKSRVIPDTKEGGIGAGTAAAGAKSRVIPGTKEGGICAGTAAAGGAGAAGAGGSVNTASSTAAVASARCLKRLIPAPEAFG